MEVTKAEKQLCERVGVSSDDVESIKKAKDGRMAITMSSQAKRFRNKRFYVDAPRKGSR